MHGYVYVDLNHFALYLKLTQHCKLTVLQFKNTFLHAKKKKNYSVSLVFDSHGA